MKSEWTVIQSESGWSVVDYYEKHDGSFGGLVFEPVLFWVYFVKKSIEDDIDNPPEIITYPVTIDGTVTESVILRQPDGRCLEPLGRWFENEGEVANYFKNSISKTS